MVSVCSLFHILLVVSCIVAAGAQNYRKNFRVTWGDERVKIHNSGRSLTLALDKYSGSAFQSKNQYLFMWVDFSIKLVPDNSAGTVTTFYLSSTGNSHDEIDFEFLGNQTGQPYTIHTNVFSQGKGSREQQFKLWFDPTKEFHTYSIAWSHKQIVFLVDGAALRVFKNLESKKVTYPKDQPMRIYASLWNADDWATQGGRVKTDWEKAPFIASYGSYKIRGCNFSKRGKACVPKETNNDTSSADAWMYQDLNSESHKKMEWVRSNYMIYDYCSDKKRYPEGMPRECIVDE